MGSLKFQKRSKWYTCFKPHVEDYPLEPAVSNCLGKGEKETMLPLNIVMALSAAGDKLDSSPTGDDEDQLGKRSKPRRSLSRAFKAVLFQSTLAKKKRSRKSGQETSSGSSSRRLSSKLDKLFNLVRDKKKSSLYKESSANNSRTDSGRSSLFSSSTRAASSSLSSSRASSIASHSRSPSVGKNSCASDLKQLNRQPTIYSQMTKGCNNANIVGLYFVLICLVALIFWGKAFAIFCTSTCFFLIPCRSKRVDDQSAVDNSDDSVDLESDEYKKKSDHGRTAGEESSHSGPITS